MDDVKLVNKAFFRKYFIDLDVHGTDDSPWLTLQAANGLHTPYSMLAMMRGAGQG